MPAGRFKPGTYKHPPPPAGTPKSGKPQPPPGVQGPVKPAGHPGVAKAGRAVGKAATAGAEQVSGGAQRDIGHVLNEYRREQLAAARRERAARMAGPAPKPQMIPNPRARSALGDKVPGEPLMILAEPAEPEWIRKTLSHKPFHYEDISDFALGKAATNVLFHGSRAHPGAAGLEVASLLPVLRPFRSLREAIAGVREARAAGSEARIGAGAAPHTTGVPAITRPERTVTIPEHAAGIKVGEHKVKVSELPARIEKLDAYLKTAQSRPRTAIGLVEYSRALERHNQYVAALEAEGAAPPPGKPPVGVSHGAQPPPPPEIGEHLPGIKRARTAQEKGYAEERGKRFNEADKAFGMAGGGEAGLNAYYGELKGELPKVPYTQLHERFKSGEYTQAHLDEDINRIVEHPSFPRSAAAKYTARGFRDMVKEGVTPTEKQIEGMATVFGPEATKQMIERSTGDKAADVIGSSRALKSMLDLSVTARQLLILGARKPSIVLATVPKQVRALSSEQAAVAIEETIHNHPLYDEANDVAKLSFTHQGTNIREREEMYPSAFVERPVTFGGRTPNVNIPGRMVRASGRAFLAGRDLSLIHAYAWWKDLLAKRGADVTDPEVLRALGRLLNSATGRGEYKPGGVMQKSAPLLNALLFAPKLIKSRIDFLNPFWYRSLYKQSPHVAAEAVQSLVQLGVGATAILGLAAYAGARVGYDPRSANFAKVKLGNTRFDPLGGFQQYLHVLAELTPQKAYGGQSWMGASVSSVTGRKGGLGTKVGQRSPLDVLFQFGQSKASPPAGITLDILRGTDFAGQPITVQKEVLGAITPLIAQDVYDVYKDRKNVDMKKAVGFATLGYLTSLWGVGMQTYHDTKPEEIQKKHEQYGQQILEGAIKTGLLPEGAGLTPQLKAALKARAGRFVFREEHGGDPKSNFTADVGYLLKIHARSRDGNLVTPQKAKAAARWAETASPSDLADEERFLSDEYFNDLYGDALADARAKLRDRGYDLPVLR